MKLITKCLFWLIILLAVFVLVAACGGTATPSAEQPATEMPVATEAAAEKATTEASGERVSEAITLVQKFYEALNQKKIDEAMTYMADDAVSYTPTGAHKGKAEIQKTYENDILKEGISWDLSGGEFKDEAGRVLYNFKVLQNGEEIYSATNGVTIVKNGKIIFDGDETNEAEWLKEGKIQ